MQITARLEESTLKQLLDELLPVTVSLGPEGDDGDDDGDGVGDRWIRIDPARTVDFVAGLGLRVEVGGKLRWKKLGLPMTIGINSAHILLRPDVVADADGRRLVFLPELEKMDLKNVPGFIDSGITEMINRRLAPQVGKLAWHFGKTLRTSFPVSRQLPGVDSFELDAEGATVEVTADAFVLTLSLAMHFLRPPTPPASPPDEP